MQPTDSDCVTFKIIGSLRTTDIKGNINTNVKFLFKLSAA